MKIQFYVWYKDTGGELVPMYVGQTNDPGRRRKEHGLKFPMRCKVIPRLSIEDVADPNRRYKAGYIEDFLIAMFRTTITQGGLNRHLPAHKGKEPRKAKRRLRELWNAFDASYDRPGGRDLAKLLGLKITSKRGITENEAPEVPLSTILK